MAQKNSVECQHPVTSMFSYDVYDDDTKESWTVTIVSCADCGKKVY